MRFKGREVVVPREKIEDYLLSTNHPVGRAKAKFFRGFGFDESCVDAFERSLIEIAHSGEPKESVVSPYGTKYVIDGLLDTPTGKQVTIRTVWVEMDDKILRFVTAYPAKQESSP